MVIRTPDYHLRVFVSSTLKELAEERKAVRQSILKLRLAPVMFESGARPHPPHELYQSYLSQSQIFIGIYWQSYGWIAPGAQVSGLEDEYSLSRNIPRLIYIKQPAPEREPALVSLLEHIKEDNTTCYTNFSTLAELKGMVQNDLILLLSEKFTSLPHPAPAGASKNKTHQTNVPIPRNMLIDREVELASACEMLKRDDTALITLTGAGGTGKSRLAIQIGLFMQDWFKDGVFLVGLEPISDPKLVMSTIASTLGICEAPGSLPIVEMLKEFLRDKQVLLLLDNFEQVVAAATRVGELLETCPHLKCVVTSRMPLRLRAERELPVPPLTVPSMQKSATLNGLSQYAAVELFIQRAQAVKPDFKVTNANAPAVAEVCYRLDGLPLAIELAAARIKLLTPQGLLDRLEHRFDLLRGGTRDLPERQRTLRSAIDWSYNLLNEEEKKLFRRLSIFAGGWTLEAAETICDINADCSGDIYDTLCSLVDNNLVIHLEVEGDQLRFGMLSTIHEYASELLAASGEGDKLHQQHINYYLDFVKKVEPLVRSPERIHWRQVMLQEFDNIRAALVWAYTSKQSIDIAQLVVIHIGMFWQFSGYIAEGRRWCALMLELCDESTPGSVRAGLLCFDGEIAWTQGDLGSAVNSLEESLEISRSLKEKHLQAISMVFRGMVAATSRDLAIAKQMLQDSVALLNTIDDNWTKALALSWLGEIALFEYDAELARSYCDQSIETARLQGDPWCMMPSYMTYGQIAVMSGDLASAELNFMEAVSLLRKAGDNWSISWGVTSLSHALLMEAKFDLASEYLSEALITGNGLGNLGVVLLSLVGSAALISQRIKTLAGDSQKDAAEQALVAHLCGATEPFINTPGVFAWADSRIMYDAAIHLAQSAMDERTWVKAFAEGHSLPLDQAVALALQALGG